jgi:signal peptidase I
LSRAPERQRAAKGAGDAEAPVAPGAGAGRSLTPTGSRPLRYLFFLVWMFAAPAALAVGAVRLLKPAPYALGAGIVRTFIGEQQVPATILFFTLFAMVLWKLRHVLPMAASAGVLGRSDLPVGARARYDEALHLISETRRIMRQRQGEVDRAVSKEDRQDILRTIEALEESMVADSFREDRFGGSYDKLGRQAGLHLRRWRKSELREYSESIGVAVAVALVLRIFVIEAFKIPSGSMIPTLMVGDHIFVAKYAYGPLWPYSDSRVYSRLPPARGEVMVFKFPEDKEQDFIKRVVAIEGDVLEVIDGRPVVNGLLLPNCHVGRAQEPFGMRGQLYVEYLGDNAYLTTHEEKLSEDTCARDQDCGLGRVCRQGACGMLQGPYRIKPGEVFVLGDNRNNSHDSRSWYGGQGGGVPFANIKGRAMFVWWSWDPRGGIATDRLFVNVMGAPKLPPGTPARLVEALHRCLQSQPPADRTTPPDRPPPG